MKLERFARNFTFRRTSGNTDSRMIANKYAMKVMSKPSGWVVAFQAESDLNVLTVSTISVGVLILGIGFLSAGAGHAQDLLYPTQYRPYDIRYEVMRTVAFDIIYPSGHQKEALEAAGILHETIDSASDLVGLRRSLRMPVVLNDYTDRSNGLVSAVPFRQEIDLAPSRSWNLSPTSRSWLTDVLSHELAHGANIEVNGGFGVGGVLAFLGADLNRMVNISAPPGLLEGAAVYQESRVHEGAGRLNYPYFNMQFWAAYVSGSGWNLAQIATPSRYSFPRDRFYIGGAHFFDFVRSQVRDDFFERTTRFYNRWPFLGYGIALWYGSGQAPWVLDRRYRSYSGDQEDDRLARLDARTNPTLTAASRGIHNRRPLWLDENRLLVYRFGYSIRPGFYTIDTATGEVTEPIYEAVTEDYYFSIDDERKHVYYSRYVPHLTVRDSWTSEVFRIDLDTGSRERLTRDGRLFAPASSSVGGFWAVRSSTSTSALVHVDGAGHAEKLPFGDRASVRFFALSPDEETGAAVVNIAGRQGLFKVDMSGDNSVVEPWLLLRAASIYDAAWAPGGSHLVFTADPGGVLNVYSLDVETDIVVQVTDVPFGAMEPALSPDGRTLAYIYYDHEQFSVAVKPFNPAADVPIAFDMVAPPEEAHLSYQATENQSYTGSYEIRDYSSLGYLVVPRIFFPIAFPQSIAPPARFAGSDEPDRSADLGWRLGAALSGVDPLLRWSYGLQGFYQARRLWGEVALESGRYVIRPGLRLYNRPFQDQISRGGETVTRAFEERGGQISAQIPFRFYHNVYQTTAVAGVNFSARQMREIGGRSEPLSPFETRFGLQPFGVLGYRIQQNPRDILPNTGLVVRASSHVDLRRAAHRMDRWGLLGFDWFLPVWTSRNHGFRIYGHSLFQGTDSFYTGTAFWLHGEGATRAITGANYAHIGTEYAVPMWYVESGLFTLPIYLNSIYAFALAETMGDMLFRGRWDSSLGGGLGVQLTLAYRLNLDLRFGISHLTHENEWRAFVR